MMFSRDAMTASATDAATPPRIPNTTNILLRLGVTTLHSLPSPRRAARASGPARDSAARTKRSRTTPKSRAQNTAKRSARNRPSPGIGRSSCAHRLAHPTRLAFAIQDLGTDPDAEHRAEEQHEAHEHREQRPEHAARHRRLLEFHDRRTLVQR